MSGTYRRNGYKMLYMPEHHRACKSDGMVYEHVFLAEIYLGRQLHPDEVVHHENEIRDDNREENLFVFANDAEHSRFHKTGIKIQTEDGSYIAQRITKNCKHCDNEFMPEDSGYIYCSKTCGHLASRKVLERPNPETLKMLIADQGYSATGRQFVVSGNAVRKWAKQYGII